MARLAQGMPRGVQATPEVLKPFYELWTNESFQDNFVKSVKTDLENFQKAMWDLDFSNLSAQNHRVWTEILGLPIPQTDEEFRRCFMSLKCCVSYVNWKLGEVERAALRFQGAQPIGG